MFSKATYRALDTWRNIDIMCGDRWTCKGCEYCGKFGNAPEECTDRILMELGEIMRSIYDDERCMKVLKVLADDKVVDIMVKETVGA